MLKLCNLHDRLEKKRKEKKNKNAAGSFKITEFSYSSILLLTKNAKWIPRSQAIPLHSFLK